jgi:hypothetical protein
MKYSEIILIDRCYIDYLENYLHNIENQPVALEGPEVINFEEENKVEPLPEDITLDALECMIVTYQHKKKYQLNQPQED